MSEREAMEFDVLIVGAGPAGLSAACKLMQLAKKSEKKITVCVIEKGSAIGSHILSGAVIESRALSELFPDWKERGAPLNTPVLKDELYILRNNIKAFKVPNVFIPKPMHNEGNFIISLSGLCRWLGEQAEAMDVDIFPGFAASEILYSDDGAVRGVATGDTGIDENGEYTDQYEPGVELLAKYTIFSEGCRGHLGKQLNDKYQLDKDADAQHYGLGIKELWEVKPENHQEGLVIHGSGWPLSDGTTGGFFLYHSEKNQIAVGLIVDLNYSNTYVSPFDEFQSMKHHPLISQYLEGGQRISYGARAITKGGYNAIPKMHFPGGLLAGCEAGTLNFAKIKGTHTAMKSGMLAAEEVYEALSTGAEGGKDLSGYRTRFEKSWVYEELYQSRSFGPALHKFGMIMGGAFNYLDQNWFKGKLPITLRDNKEDYAQTKFAKDSKKIEYPKPDGKLSFDKLSSVFLSSTNHAENQPSHLQLADASIPISKNLPDFDEPAQRYCPAGVYEIIEEEGKEKYFQINSQNCVHCKTYDIKDPAQNITWVTPEGSGGPNYPNM